MISGLKAAVKSAVKSDDSIVHDPHSFYDRHGIKEWERLEESLAGEIEFDATCEYLEAYLPDGGHILDAGGGPGRYSLWLCEQGYDVTLLDLSRTQLEIAKKNRDRADLESNLRIVQGSIDAIPTASDQFDATLCTGGPLSSLLDETKRRAAVAELHRVTAPSSFVFVSVMGRLDMIQKYLYWNKKTDALPELAATGTYDAALLDKHGYTSSSFECHFFRADELRNLLQSSGFDVQRVAGLEGIASLPARVGGLDDLDETERQQIESLVRQLREEPAVADFSSHMLAIGETQRETSS